MEDVDDSPTASATDDGAALGGAALSANEAESAADCGDMRRVCGTLLNETDLVDVLWLWAGDGANAECGEPAASAAAAAEGVLGRGEPARGGVLVLVGRTCGR